MSALTTDLQTANLPTVALAFMNEVHAEELALVQGLAANLEQGSDAMISAQLAAWIEHTQAHFAREEFLMHDYQFFAYPMHQSEHRQALQQLKGVQQTWNEQADRALLGAYIHDWRAWLQQHIMTMDFVTAQFLSRFPIPQASAEIDQLRTA
ncbi:MAG: hypothetical protein E6Q85_02960 [Thiothrix sp.]|nr:MAG: hypothetical protein E6Q85_02960 [Thiothrix sp.]